MDEPPSGEPAVGETEKGSTRPGQADKRPRHAARFFFSLIALFIIGTAVYLVPIHIRPFLAFGILAGLFVIVGLYTLIVLIPQAGSAANRPLNVKTEFYSARAAYFAVLAGLVLLCVITVGAVYALVVTTVGGH